MHRCKICFANVNSTYQLYYHNQEVHNLTEITQSNKIASCTVCSFEHINCNVLQLHISLSHPSLYGKFFIIKNKQYTVQQTITDLAQQKLFRLEISQIYNYAALKQYK